MDNIIVRLTRESESTGDSFTWTGSDTNDLKDFVKEIALNDALIEDALSDNPTIDHNPGTREYLESYFSDENDTWEGILDFDYYDQDCSISLEVIDLEKAKEILYDSDAYKTLEEFKSYILQEDTLRELADNMDIVLYDPNDFGEIVECLQELDEKMMY